MATKVDKTAVNLGSGNLSGTITSTSSPKVSMFSAKAGFVIPKNKLLGSMVPIFRGGAKLGVIDPSDGENNKQVKRKTKWGPDLTLDTTVRKGRALAYQTRVDQITQLLSSGTSVGTEFQEELIETENLEEKISLAQANDGDLQLKSEMLELEKLEAIGEILKLNPSFKVPSNYKPLLKEDKFPIPVKEYPGFNFIGLIYGPNGENRKRIEKETGAKIKICGVKAETMVKEELKPTDGFEIQNSYGELYVHVSADTFDKIDAAASLVELLLTSISGNLPVVSTSSVDGDIVPNQSEVVTTSGVVPGAVLHQGVVQQMAQSSSQGQFQYPGQWSQPGSSHVPMSSPRFMSLPNHSAPILNTPVYTSPSTPSYMPSLFGPPPVQGAGFNATFQNPHVFPPRFQSPVPQQQLMSDRVGQSGFPSMVAQQPLLVRPNGPPLSFSHSQPPPTELTGLSVPPRPQQMSSISPGPLLVRPPTPSGPSPGWPGAMAGIPCLVPTNIRQMTLPMDSHHGPPELRGLSPNIPGNMNTMPQSGLPTAFSASFQPATVPAPRPMNQGGSAPISSLTWPSFPSQGSGDFSFRPQWMQNTAAQAIQAPAAHNVLQPPAPQIPSVRFSVPTSTPRPVNQAFPHAQAGGLVGQHQGPMSSTLHSGLSVSPRLQGFMMRTPSPHISSPSFGPPSPILGPYVAFPPRPANVVQPQNNYPARGIRPGLPLGPSQQFIGNLPFGHGKPPFSGGQQIYDPFSPTVSTISPKQQYDGNPSK